MNTPPYRKRSFITGERVVVLIVLLLIVLVPSQTLAATMGWIRCNMTRRDICYTDGNVGIGLSDPETNLDVVGTGKFGDALFLSGASGDLIVSDNSIYEFKRIVLTNDDIINVNDITIHDPGPNEGIRWNQAGAKIYVAPLDNTNYDGYLRLINDGGIAFEPGAESNQAMVLNADGNMGLGTNTPNSLFEVSGGYIELDTHNGMPPDADCDAQDEVGRMVVDSRRPYLYICTAGGWTRK